MKTQSLMLRFLGLFSILVQLCSCQAPSYFLINEESADQHVGYLNLQNGQRYRLSPSSDLFQLIGGTGELRTLRPIDRESLEASVINLLAVSDSGLQAPIEITVEIEDINDNDPVFPADQQVIIDLPESTEIGTQFVLPTAVDYDSPQNGVSTNYAIVEGDEEKFGLFVDSSPGDESLLYLRTKQHFNREETNHYQLNISATDDGDPPRSGYLSVSIEILDSNDNEPDFDISHYSASIPENTPVGSVILEVHATDPDEGNNGLVRYRIGAQSESKGFFSIDPIEGHLKLNRELDYESEKTHRLTLEAYDAGDPVLFGRAFVTITVENVNDNVPVVNFRFLPPTASIASVNEGAVQGTPVVLVTVTDKDSSRSDPAELKLSLTSGNEMNAFELNEVPNLNFWELKVLKSISRFSTPSYNLTFCAEDIQFSVIKTCCKSLSVVVNSPNEHPPVFFPRVYHVTLSEISPFGTYVTAVNASDPDTGIVGRLRYRIDSGNDLQWFQIDSYTGIITTAQRIDYDIPGDKTIQLMITTYDETLSPLTSNATVYIDITGVNDNAPQFDSDYYRVSVDIGSLPTNVIQVNAIDQDLDQIGNPTYTIENIYPTSSSSCSSQLPHFTINDDGLVRLLSLPALPHELSSYNVVVSATDGGENRLSSSTTIQITLTETGSDVPVFYPQVYFASLQSPSLSNPLIVTVKATTGERSQSDRVRYAKASGDSRFNVEADSGNVIVTSEDFSSDETFTMTVNALANDRTASQPATVHIIINPTITVGFSELVYEFEILEALQPLMTVGAIGIPSDSIHTTDINYYIVNGNMNDKFALDQSTGVISVNKNLDSDEKSLFNLTIVAALLAENGDTNGFASCTVLIHVVDVNDNTPYFLNGRKLNATDWTVYYEDQAIVYLMPDRSYVRETLYNATARDCDSGLNGNILYSIDDPLNSLEVDKTGIIMVERVLPDFHRDYVNDVIVSACDQGSPCRCSHFRLRVIVRRWLEALLEDSFSNDQFRVTVQENASAGTKLLHLSRFLPGKYRHSTAVNQNGSLKTVVDYMLISDNPHLFGVFPDGLVYLKQSLLDRELQSAYNLIASIRLHENIQAFNYNVSIHVCVQDVNDNQPEFQFREISFELERDSSPQTIVGYVKATDRDLGINAESVYALKEAHTLSGQIIPFPFAVDRYSGAITTNCEINFQALKNLFSEQFLSPQVFAFHVTAKNIKETLSSFPNNELLVKVHIRDNNHSSPRLSRAYYFANVSEDSMDGTDVIRIEASGDSRKNNVTYRIQSDIADFPFAIDDVTGAISVSRSSLLDREIAATYIFSVNAVYSNGAQQLISTSTVQVELLDVNDNPPRFNQSTLSWKVSEDAEIHHVIGKIKASDPDESGPNSTVIYALSSASTNEVRSLFRIDESSGYIVLVGHLDRETTKTYDLIVEALDQGLVRRNTATTTVRVAVENANDEVPRITSPKTFQILEGHYDDPHLIGVVSAVDGDSGENGRLTYEIIKLSPFLSGPRINILPLTGHLYLTGTVDRERLPDSKFDVTILVSDSPFDERNRLRTIDTVEIFVEDENDNSPDLVSPDTIFIPENMINVIGYNIATVLARDPDNGVNGSVRFVETNFNENEAFRIQPDTGVIQINNPLSPEHSVLFTTSILVQDQGFPEKYTLEMINIVVGNYRSQNGPLFNSLSYGASVLENSTIGTQVITITAGGNEVEYFIVGVLSENDVQLARRPFSIDSQSGTISINEELDREEFSSYTLIVAAVDMTSTVSNPRISSSQVLITVLDVDDNRPEFPKTHDVRRVSESARPGHVIATVTASDADQTPVLVYSLQPDRDSEKFLVNPNNGEVSIRSSLDREMQARYIITVIASDGTHRSSTILIIEVDDVNDNDPTFSSDQFVFAVQEGLSAPPSVGRYVGLIEAFDTDVGNNAQLAFRFVNGSDQGRFKLEAETGILSLNPSYVEAFDRESRDLFVFVVRATDGGGRFSDVVVYVNIKDINDNFPIFNSTSIDIEISEEVEIGHQLTDVHAEDKDLGFNAIVQYRIVGGDPFRHFSIGLDSGIITTQKRLNKETEPKYSLLIMATDLGNPRKTSILSVAVLVNNVNDNPPVPILPGTIYIDQNARVGDFILQVGAFDTDEVSSNLTLPFHFSLSLQSPSGEAFSIDSNSGEIRIDSENFLANEYNLTIVVSDQGLSPLSQTRTLAVRFNSENKHNPVFEPESISQILSVKEDLQSGKTITQIRAGDADQGLNGLVQYRFSYQSFPQVFRMDSLTGSIYLVGTLDYESIASFHLTVEAYDSGSPVRFAVTNITINVVDVNDCQPVLSPITSLVHVKENTQPVANLIQLEVSDNDSGNGGKVDFRGPMVVRATKNNMAVSTSPFTNYFEVSDEGQVSLIEALDREEVDRLHVVITAVDRGDPALSGTASILVIVDDVNESPPRFQPSTYRASVFENATVGEFVAFVNAVDDDVGSHRCVRFVLESSNVPFLLNPSTGEITISARLDRQSRDFYELLVTAVDGEGDDAKSASATVEIKILGDNGNASRFNHTLSSLVAIPQFSNPIYVGRVREDVQSGAIITVAATYSSSTDSNSDLEYRILTSESEFPERFNLESDTGIIRNRVALNREEKDSYFLTATVSSRSAPELTDDAVVHIYVDDVNDNGPSFSRLYSATIREDAAIGEFVVQVTSTDQDTEIYSQNRYSLTGEDYGKFRIDSDTGVITVNGKLDRENQSSYTLQVTAGDDSWSAHTTVSIEVTDVNDNTPLFSHNTFHVDVSWGIKAGVRLLAFEISDLDAGRNKQVFFELDSCSEYFTINHTTGELFTARKLLCSSSQDLAESICPVMHKVIVKVIDLGIPRRLSSSAVVIVTVHPTNYHDAEFEASLPHRIAVLQTSDVGTVIFKTEANDKDGTGVTFRILNTSQSEYFRINQSSGVVSSNKLFSNFALGSTLDVALRVEDNGFPRRYSDQTFVVEVTGRNRDRPTFDRESYAFPAVAEDVVPGTIIATVSADDADSGINGKVIYSLSDQDSDKPFQINSNSGVLRTAAELDFEKENFYSLTVIASDCAVLSKNSSAVIMIHVTDVNDNPPQFNSSQFVVYVSENTAQETKLTRVLSTDADSSENAVTSYEVHPQTEFMIRSSTGDIFTAVSTDLNYEARSSYQLQVMAFDNHDGSVLFSDSALLQVVLLDVNEFKPRLLHRASVLKVSVSSGSGSIIGHFQATDEDGGAEGQVIYVMAGWSENQGLKINANNGDLCVSEDAELRLGDVINVTIFMKNPGLAGPTDMTRFDLTILVITDDCMEDPCENGGTCVDGRSGFVCDCAPGFTGALCQEDINDCFVNPCLNGGQCTDLINDFLCICPAGLTGKVCDIDIDFCENNPCQNNSTCQDGLTTYTCLCPFEATGKDCERNSLGFYPLSYLRLSGIQSGKVNISFEFATTSSSALLIYNFAEQSKVNFVALEIVQERIRFSYRLSSASSNRTFVGSQVANGNWHRLKFTIDGDEATISLDDCEITDASCSSTIQFSSSNFEMFLSLMTQNLYIGGVENVEDIVERPGQVSSHDFVGCLRSLQVNSDLIEDVTSPVILSYVGVVDGCDRNPIGCGSSQFSPCGVGSTCTDFWFNVLCDCPSDRSGSRCEYSRVGSGFNGKTTLRYRFSPAFIRQNLLSSSGVLSSFNARKKRSTDERTSCVSVRFRSRLNGPLLAIVSTDGNVLSTIEIDNAALFFTIQTPSLRRSILISEEVLDGTWHDVSIELSSNLNVTDVEITFDQERVYRTSYTAGLSSFVDPSQVDSFYLGGTPSVVNTNFFEGCIFSFSVDNQSLPLTGNEQNNIFEVEEILSNGLPPQDSVSGVSNQCSGPDVCASNPCQSTGLYCNDTWFSYECVPIGYCDSAPCLNGATCVPHSVGSYHCLCADGYTGVECQTFIPCLNFDCAMQGLNQECIASENTAVCQCLQGYELVDGECVMAAALASQIWWIYAISAIGLIFLVLLVSLLGRYFILKRRLMNKNDKEKSQPKLTNESKNDLTSSKSTEFSKVVDGVIQHLPHQSRPDLLSEDVRAVDEEAISGDKLSSPNMLSNDKLSQMNEFNSKDSISPSDVNKLEVVKNTRATKPTSPLPSYEILMQERRAQKASATPLLQSVNNQKSNDAEAGNPRNARLYIHHKPNGSLLSETSSSNHPNESSSSSFYGRVSDFDRAVYNKSKPKVPPKQIPSSSNSSFLSATNVQHIPKGKVSPTKSPNPFSFLQPQIASSVAARDLSVGYSKPYRLHNKKSPGSVDSSIGSSFSSSSSSSSHPRFAAMQEEEPYPSINHVMKQLNGLVGLTREEIEILNENPPSDPRTYSDAPNATTLNYQPNNAIKPSQNTTKSQARPSSLPGQRLHRETFSKRSQTPMTLPVTSSFQPAFDEQTKENDSMTSFSTTQLREDSAHRQKFLPDPSGEDKPLQLDLLMSYGIHYEALAGVFEDLAALPSTTDERETNKGFSFEKSQPSSSKIEVSKKSNRIKRRASTSLTTTQSKHPSVVPRSKTPSSIVRSPVSNSSFQSSCSNQSSATKRQEHYV